MLFLWKLHVHLSCLHSIRNRGLHWVYSIHARISMLPSISVLLIGQHEHTRRISTHTKELVAIHYHKEYKFVSKQQYIHWNLSVQAGQFLTRSKPRNLVGGNMLSGQHHSAVMAYDSLSLSYSALQAIRLKIRGLSSLSNLYCIRESNIQIVWQALFGYILNLIRVLINYFVFCLQLCK